MFNTLNKNQHELFNAINKNQQKLFNTLNKLKRTTNLGVHN